MNCHWNNPFNKLSHVSLLLRLINKGSANKPLRQRNYTTLSNLEGSISYDGSEDTQDIIRLVMAGWRRADYDPCRVQVVNRGKYCIGCIDIVLRSQNFCFSFKAVRPLTAQWRICGR